MEKTVFVLLVSLIFSVMTEKAYAAEVKLITLATDDWEPYYGPSLENDGFTVDIVGTAFQRTGYDLKIVYLPWKRALLMGEIGKKCQGVFGLYYTDERNQKFIYSDAFAVSVITFFKRAKEKISYRTLKDIAPYSVGVIAGYTNTLEFDAADYITKDVTADQVKNIQKLISKRVDLIIGSYNVITHALKTKLPESVGKIEPVYPPLKSNNLYFAISRMVPGHGKIIGDFNKGLKMIKDDGTYHKILNKHGL